MMKWIAFAGVSAAVFLSLAAADGRAQDAPPPPDALPDSWSESPELLDEIITGAAPSNDPDILYLQKGAPFEKYYRYSISAGTLSLLPPLPSGTTSAFHMTSSPASPLLCLVESKASIFNPLSPPGPSNYYPRFFIYDPQAGPAGAWTTGPELQLKKNDKAHSIACSGNRVFVQAPHKPGVSSFLHALWSHTLGSGSWSIIQQPPLPTGGSTLVYPGSGNLIFGFKLDPGLFWSHDFVLGEWTLLADDDPATPAPAWPLPKEDILTVGPGPSNSLIFHVAGDGFGDWEGVDARLYQYRIDSDDWSQIAVNPTNSVPGPYTGGLRFAYPGAGDSVYFFKPDNAPSTQTELWRYSLSQDRFLMTLTPGAPGGVALIGTGNGEDLFVLRKGGAHAQFVHYSVSADAWTPKATSPDALPSWPHLTAAYDGGDHIYVAVSKAPKQFWRYTISTDSWLTDPAVLAPLPATWTGAGGSLTYAPPGHLYMYIGGLYRYSILENEWKAMDPAPGTVSFMTYPGTGDFVYAVGGANALWAYSLTLDRWNVTGDGSLPFDPPDPPNPIGGPLVAHPSGKGLYAADSLNHSIYLIDRQEWLEAAPPPYGIVSAAFADAGDRLYALGSNNSWAFLRYQVPDLLPEVAALGQYLPDGSMQVAHGETIISTSIALAVGGGDPLGEATEIEVEVKPVDTGFDGSPTIPASAILLGDGSTLVTIAGLPQDVEYHWQVRRVDARGSPSPWVSFGSDPDDPAEPDFILRSNTAPVAASPLQISLATQSAVPAGGRLVDQEEVLFTALVVDDHDDPASLEIEVVRVGESFTSAPTAVSGLAPSGQERSILLSFEEGPYRWKYRVRDSFGAAGDWKEFGDNAENAADFQLILGGSTNVDSGFCVAAAARPGASFPILLLLALAAFRRGRTGPAWAGKTWRASPDRSPRAL